VDGVATARTRAQHDPARARHAKEWKAAIMPLAPGTFVTPQLRLVRMFGEGGMGCVWVAEHLTLRTHVAVKFVSAALARDGATVARFSREAAAVAQMRNPHVVQVFDHGVTTDGTPYIVMELLDGEDLASRVARRGRLGLDETARIVSQTSKALSKAHSLGLVHRDIKPDNIFLTDLEGEDFVKVLDFGIAKPVSGNELAAGSLTSTGALVGTPFYMSPEQAVSAKHVDMRSDLWSLAVVAYHCVTGRVPFEGETVVGLFLAIDKGVFTPPTKIAPEMPASMDAWFARALARDVNARFATAKELAETFEEATRGAAVRLECASGGRPQRRSRAFASARRRPRSCAPQHSRARRSRVRRRPGGRG
jgi:serine/threonine-protein kinase